jgi:hypothetical protein
MRFPVAANRKLTNKVHDIVTKAIMNYPEEQCDEGSRPSNAGWGYFFSAFRRALNLNFHMHLILIDGVYAMCDGRLQFYHLSGPSDNDVIAVLEAIATATSKMLQDAAL